MLDPAFIAVLRRHLRYLLPGEQIEADAPLRDLGLDSLAAVSLVMELESAFSVALDETSLRPETFTSAATLWDEIARAARL